MPTADIAWRDQPADLTCLVCGYVGLGTHIADVTALGQLDLPVVRCPDCQSLRMYGPTADPTPDDAAIDAYLEGGVQ